jgi:hypothetical protein
VSFEDVPELKRTVRRLQEPFRVSDVYRSLPEGMRDLRPRGLGTALVTRGVCVPVGYDRVTRSRLLVAKGSIGMTAQPMVDHVEA